MSDEQNQNSVDVGQSDSNALLAAAVSNEAAMWSMALDHVHLHSMWNRRIMKETHRLSDDQAKAVTIVQVTAYALAFQAVTIRMMSEMTSLVRLYGALKSS